MAIKEAKVVPMVVVTEPAWLDYDRYWRDYSASADPAQYCHDCIATVRQLGAQAETRASLLRQRVNEDTHHSEAVTVGLEEELDKVDEQIDGAADLIGQATVDQRQVGLQRVRPPLVQAYRQLQQAIDDLARIERRCDRY